MHFQHTYGSRSPITIVETMGGAAVFLDVDGDGNEDLFLVNAGQDFRKPRQEPGSRLFHNRGGGQFEDWTSRSGLKIDAYATGACVGDFDNDGRDDLFVTGFGRNFLYRNRAGGRFEDVTERAGILRRPDAWGTGCAFVDGNRDGWLDLYVANYVRYDPKVPLCSYGGVMSGCTPDQYHTQAHEYYVNRRNGTFTERAAALGAADPTGAGLGVLTCDFDNDGWPDIFVANDATPNALLHNEKGRFRDVAEAAGVAFAESGKMRAGMGTDAADYDGDGRFDLVITNFQYEPSSLYHQEAGLTFTEETQASGFGAPTVSRLKFGICFADLDGDGRPDLYVGDGHVLDNVAQTDPAASFEQLDQVFLNLGHGKFRELTPETGALPSTRSVARGVSVGDCDNDGSPDILINNLGRPARLLVNHRSVRNHWLGLSLRGSHSNRSAIGARVELTGPGGTQLREVRSGGSYMSQSDLRPLFGLGPDAAAEGFRLRIRWPNGNWQNVRVPAIDRYLRVTEGKASDAWEPSR